MNMKVPLFDIPDKVVESLDVNAVLATSDDMVRMQIDDPPFRDFTVRLSLRSSIVISYEMVKSRLHERNDIPLGSKKDLADMAADNWGDLIMTIRYRNFERTNKGLIFNAFFKANESKDLKSPSLFSTLDLRIKTALSRTIYSILIVLLATKNIDRKVVINSARSGSKRARDDAKSYSSTTYLNIGKITETCRGSSSGSKSGGPTRPHLRRGHIRLQRYGEGLKESKQIFIQPTFVNADKEWIDRQKTYKFTGSHDASASSGLTASRETRKREIVDHVG
jgi:hypothetical protein